MPIVLGIAIIISSAVKIQYAFDLKNSENDDGLVIRFSETSGMPTAVTVNFKAINKSFSLNFTSQEVKTIKLNKDGKIEEIKIIE